MTSNFETVYNMSEASRADGTFIILLMVGSFCIVITAVCLARLIRYGTHGKGWTLLALLLVWCLFATVFALRARPIKEPDYSKLGKSVEGVVHVLHVQPKEGHDQGDVITIAGERFEIQHFISWDAYKQTIAYGGVLTEGAYARVSWPYDDPHKPILQVDVDRARSQMLPIPPEATQHQGCVCRR